MKTLARSHQRNTVNSIYAGAEMVGLGRAQMLCLVLENLPCHCDEMTTNFKSVSL